MPVGFVRSGPVGGLINFAPPQVPWGLTARMPLGARIMMILLPKFGRLISNVHTLIPRRSRPKGVARSRKPGSLIAAGGYRIEATDDLLIAPDGSVVAHAVVWFKRTDPLPHERTAARQLLADLAAPARAPVAVAASLRKAPEMIGGPQALPSWNIAPAAEEAAPLAATVEAEPHAPTKTDSGTPAEADPGNPIETGPAPEEAPAEVPFQRARSRTEVDNRPVYSSLRSGRAKR